MFSRRTSDTDFAKSTRTGDRPTRHDIADAIRGGRLSESPAERLEWTLFDGPVHDQRNSRFGWRNSRVVVRQPGHMHADWRSRHGDDDTNESDGTVVRGQWLKVRSQSVAIKADELISYEH